MKILSGIALAGVATGALVLFFSLYTGKTAKAQNDALLLPAPAEAQEPIAPLPQHFALDARKVALGRKLFHETLLSHDNTLSCASCHDLATGGTDRKTRSVGINHAIVAVNSPTVYNSGLNYKQFWNARAETLEDQVDGPTQAAKEMGSNWPEILGKISQKPDYVAEFQAVYPNGVQHENVKDAIAAFERSLITPNARFDRYLRGETNALTADEKQGYQLFKSYGCVSCHQGRNIGGNMLAKFGVMADYFAVRGEVTEADYGRYNITKEEADRYVFRVPSLRNTTLTGPYFHDGSAVTLEAAVTTMTRYQLGRVIETRERDLLIQFLKTLEGDTAGGRAQ